MNIDNGEEDGNALTLASHEQRFIHGIHHVHFAMSGCDHQAAADGDAGVWIAEEIQSKHRKEQPEDNQKRRNGHHKTAKQSGDNAGSQDQPHDDQGEQDQLVCRLSGFPKMFHRHQLRV